MSILSISIYLRKARREGIAAAFSDIQVGQDVASELLGALVEALPAEMIDSDDEEQLEELISEAPAGPIREALQRKLDEVRRQRGGTLSLEARLREWIETPNWNASRTYLEQHQDELLTEEAEAVLQRMVETNPNRREYSRHLELLRGAQRDGIAAAYMRIRSQDPGVMLLSALGVAMIQATPAERFSEEELDRLIAQAPTDDIREALQRKLDEVRRRRGGTSPLEARLREWIETPNWNASRAYLERHQSELLTDEAEVALQRMAEANPNRRQYSQHLELLRKARRESIAAAYARIRAGQDLATTLLSGLASALVESVPAERFTEEELEQLIAQAPTDDIRETLQRKLDEVRRRRGSTPPLETRLREWIATPNWNASRAYLERHQSELLTDEAEVALQRMAEANPNRREYSQHLELLRKARRESIAAAYARIQAERDLATTLLSGLASALVESVPAERFTEEELEQLIVQAPTDDIRETLQRKLDEVRRRRGDNGGAIGL